MHITIRSGDVSDLHGLSYGWFCVQCACFLCVVIIFLYLSTITINIANIQYNKTVSCFADYRISAWYFRYTAGARINIFVFDIFNC